MQFSLTELNRVSNRARQTYSKLQSVRGKINDAKDQILLLEHFSHWVFRFIGRETEKNDTNNESEAPNEGNAEALVPASEEDSTLIDQLLEIFHSTKRKLTTEEKFFLRQIIKEENDVSLKYHIKFYLQA